MDILMKLADGRTDLVLELKDHEISPKGAFQGAAIIQWCAYYGDVSAIRYLKEQGVPLEELGPNYDLNGAVFHGHWQLTQFLLEQGADPNYALVETGETPLHSVLSKPNRPVSEIIVRLLLAYGARPNTRTRINAETGGFMRDAYTKGETPLHRAAAFGNADTIKALLDAGGDRKIEDGFGHTPLGWASWHHRPGRILKLLSYGPHKINEKHVRTMQSDHGSGWGGGESLLRMGNPHLPEENNSKISDNE